MKKFFNLLNIVFFAALVLSNCTQPVDEEAGNKTGDNANTTDQTETELKAAPSVFTFNFTPAQLVVGDDGITGGKVAGTFTPLGGSGSYTFTMIIPGGADDDLFEIVGNELKIASTVDELAPGPYSVLVRVEDSEGLSSQKYCTMEVTRSPALITVPPKVYPYMLYDGTTKAETGYNKLNVQWSKSVGATDYTVYISKASAPSAVETYELTEEVAAAADYKKEITTFDESGLPKGETYLVWLTAKNDDGATPASPKATVTTSQPVQEWWYKQDGNDIILWDSDTDEYVFNATTVAYAMSKYPDISFTSYKGVIRHHVKFDRDEARTVQRYTQIGKWGENLSAGESGVIIIEYIHPGMENYNNPDDMDDGVLRNHRPPYLMNPGLAAGSERYFFGVYYWGAGATFQPSAGHANHILAKPHIGMRMMYSSNSWPLSGNVGPCDKATYEEALDIYTLKNMHHYIAFIATPWYPVFDGMVYASVGYPCPHHHPKTASGRLMTSGTYNGQYEYTFTNQHAGTQIGVSFDIGAEGLPAGQQARTGFKLADYGDYVMTKTVYSPTSTVQYAMTDDVLSVINTTPGVIMFP